MEKIIQAQDKTQSLFSQPGNRYDFELFYKYLSQPAAKQGFVLCKGMAGERNRIFSFFKNNLLNERIQYIDMADPPTDTIAIQEIIADIHETIGIKKDIFFIYNMESCIELLKTGNKDFLEKLNMIRDFFMRYESLFVFFMSEWLVKEMIRYAFDFYDWMKLTFTFIPEEKPVGLPQKLEEMKPQKYSRLDEKIEYLEEQIKKIKDKRARLQILLSLGELYLQTGNYKLSLKYNNEALAIVEQLPGVSHYDRAAAYDNLSHAYQSMGKFDLALEFQLKSVAIMEKVLSANHPDLATSYNNLSMIYQEMGQLVYALSFQLRTNEIFEKIYDSSHPNLATSYNNLSLIYKDMGQLNQALKFQLKALAIFEKVLTHDHPDLATSYNNLSLIYKDMGQLDRALEYQLKAMTIREKVLAHDHPDLAQSYNNLSSIYRAMDKLGRALEFQLKAIAIMERLFPNGHPILDEFKKNLERIKKKM